MWFGVFTPKREPEGVIYKEVMVLVSRIPKSMLLIPAWLLVTAPQQQAGG